MAIWTFVVEFGGGTYSSQFQADDLHAAIDQYNAKDPSGFGAVPLDLDAVELEGLENIFCTGGLTEDAEKSIFANIVKTDISK